MSHLIKSQIVQAGAGTGKTTRLKDEVFRALQRSKATDDRHPRLIICTFTRKATQELKRRLFEEAVLSQEAELISYISSPSLFISTIHGILSLFLKQHGHDLGLSARTETAEEKERRIANKTAEELLFGNYFPLLEEIPFPTLRHALIFYAKHKLIDPRLRLFSEKELKDIEEKDQKLFSERTPAPAGEPDFAAFVEKQRKKDPCCFEAETFGRIFSDFEPLAEEFSKKFWEQKKRDGVMTMEDIELLSLDLLNRKPETGRLFSAEWDHWFIDEYQDTSRVQEQIIQKITGFNNVFCVGDPKQSIYLFRGADPEVFNKRVKGCPEPPQTLKTNYRSQNGLIYFFNDFFPEEKGFLPLNPPEKTDAGNDTMSSQAPDTFPKSGNKSKVTPDGKAGRAEGSAQGGRAKTLSQNAGKKPSAFFIYYDEKDSFFEEAVHAQIQKFLKQGEAPGNIAVLGRKNEPLSRLARFLKTKHIPVRLSSRRGLSRQRLILDTLFFLKFLINPHDNENFLGLCRTPYFRVSDEELVRWRQSQKEESGSLSLWNFVRERVPSCETAQILKTYNDLKQEKGIYHTFERGLFERGFMDLTQFQDPSGLVEAYLWNLLTKVHSARKAMEHPLTLFYSLMEEEEGADSFQEETGSKEDLGFVRLMTIHAAKGLQFKNVIVFDLSKRIQFQAPREKCVFDPEKGRMAFSVPLKGRDQEKIRCYRQQRFAEKKKYQEMRETDRLLYVALTRAEETVTLMVPFKPKPPAHSWFERFDFFRRLQDPLQGKSDEKKKQSTEEGKGSGKKEPARLESFRHSETKTEGQNRPGNSPGCEKTVDDNDDNLPVRTGLHYVRDNYCFSVEYNPAVKTPSPVKSSPPPLLCPLPEKPAVSLLRKTAGDFVKDMSEDGEKHLDETPSKEERRLDETPPTKENRRSGGAMPESQGNKLPLDSNAPRTQILAPSHRINIFLKTELGRFLHDCLKLLSFHPLDTLEKKISQSGFSEKERERLKSALHWTAGLKDPDILYFLKTGFAEQPFQLKESSLILHGRIDLWGRKDGTIHVFDYKSTAVLSPAVWNQLSFYSYALEKIHRPERIIMCAIYPLAQKIERRPYSGEYRDRIALWISRQTELSRSDPKILL